MPNAETIIRARLLFGMSAQAITVECHIGSGVPGTTIVGLAAGAVREARDRVKSAITNAGFDYPDGALVINLAPGELIKSQTALDLPIALAVLAASRQIPSAPLAGLEFAGELGLYGELRRVNGAIAFASAAALAGRQIVLPVANAREAGLLQDGVAGLAEHLHEVTAMLNQKASLLPPPRSAEPAPAAVRPDPIIGQQAVKRALVVAAAGGHHLLMVGPPGTGKTALARAFVDLLPPLHHDARLEVAGVYSAAGISRDNYDRPPLRDPHHSATAPALVGGGNPPYPGEIALAHNGVLFLDEIPHFKPSVLNLLREPIETGSAVITRANYRVSYPCRFQLIAAMNPCPAGRTCREDACRCNPAQVRAYQARLSGPILDRIDIQVEVPALSEALLKRLRERPPRPVTEPRAQVAAARRYQLDRQGVYNANLAQTELRRHMREAGVDEVFLEDAAKRFQISARGYLKLWRMARTIADLSGEERICQGHMAEAMSYRSLDWEAGV